MEVKFYRNIPPELRKIVDTYLDFTTLPFEDENLEVLQAYYRCFSPKLDYTRKTQIFKLACGNNQLLTAEWLVDTFHITAESVMDNNYVFRSACLKGHLDMARWLYRKFGFSKDDFASSTIPLLRGISRDTKSSQYDIIRVVVSNGHLNIIKWLVENLEMRFLYTNIFVNACIFGKINIAEWALLGRSRGEKFDLSLALCDSFSSICGNGYLEIAKLLYDNLEYGQTKASRTPSELRRLFDYTQSLYNACDKGHIEVVKWILDIFPKFSEQVIQTACEHAADSGHVDVEELLTTYIKNS
jgi:hypothetical protein